MSDFKLEYTEPDKVYLTSDGADQVPPEPEYDYYEVEVEKTLTSSVFIRVPKGLDPKALDPRVKQGIIDDAAADIASYDWDEDGIDGFNWRGITEDDALMYEVYEFDG